MGSYPAGAPNTGGGGFKSAIFDRYLAISYIETVQET